VFFPKIISSPILKLSDVAKKVSENQDFTVRMERKSDDEIGVLIDSFNKMLNQIQKRDSDLEAMIDKLERSNHELNHFAYIASHDLREPLRKISAFGEILAESLENKLGEDDQESLYYLIDGADRMQQMIEALLTYSRVSTKNLDFKVVDLNIILEELMSFELSVKIEETKAVILVPESLHSIMADPTQIRQLLQNLIGNSLKYQKKGNTPEIIISTRLIDNSFVRVEVRDNGIGIKEKDFKKLFTMFKRLNTKDKYEGTGIGLAACKKIVERHHGNIGVSSTYGQGSTFWFTVPAKCVNMQEELITSSLKA
jgi:light-regulated signal transduction histidine kinase (bacteriophytochrome)